MIGWLAAIGATAGLVSLSIALAIVSVIFFVVLPRGYEVSRDGITVLLAFRFDIG